VETRADPSPKLRNFTHTHTACSASR